MSPNRALRPERNEDGAPFNTQAITVRQGRLVIDVEFPHASQRYCTPDIIGRLLVRYPDLPYHACVNDEGQTFAAVMNTTDLPHLLEHLTISEMVAGSSKADASFAGTTEWTSQEQGRACIQVGFDDDLEALRSYKRAALALAEAMREAE